jgi:protein-disulfide isomerase-like protein with CxxC motif
MRQCTNPAITALLAASHFSVAKCACANEAAAVIRSLTLGSTHRAPTTACTSFVKSSTCLQRWSASAPASLAQVEGEPTQRHINGSRALLKRVGSEGFPTFTLEADGRLSVIDVSAHFGHPRQWQAWLRTQAGSPATDARRGC